MAEEQIRDIVDYISVLLKDTDYVLNGELDRNYVIDQLNNQNSKLIEILLEDDYIKQHYVHELAENIINFDVQSLIKQLTYKKYYNNSYTQHANDIGLYADGRSLNSLQNVVLNFPYKDTVLTGGMTKEEVEKADKDSPSKKQINNLADSVGTEEAYLNEVINYDDIISLKEPKAFTEVKRYEEGNIDGVETEVFNKDDNLIIKGNNLIALHTVKKRYSGKIKLIYIDPPYNTGSDSFEYNDNFNHSTWLIFMKNRLEIAKELLSDDGVILVQCDDNEHAYLKVLMDEIFNNGFVKTLHLQMSIVQGEKVRAAKNGNVVKNGEYIHIYSKSGKRNIVKNSLYEPTTYDTHYSIYIQEDNTEIPLVEFCLQNDEISALLDLAGFIENGKLTNKNLGRAYDEIEAFREFIHEHADRIARTHTMINVDESELVDNPIPNKTYIYETDSRNYYYGFSDKGVVHQRILLIDKLKRCDDYYNDYRVSTLRGDWWPGFYLDMGNINKETIVSLDNGQKPERLLQNIIHMVTSEGDIILDFFMGSGTTMAVAHKMNRQYIGIEQMDYIDDLVIPRLQNVINGEETGVSRRVNWIGGGSFIYAKLFEDNYEFVRQLEDARTHAELWAVFDSMREVASFRFQIKLDKISPEFIPDDIPINELRKLMINTVKTSALYVNASETEDPNLRMNESDRKFNKSFFEGELNE